jgi:DNA-binding NtrC family response regulator
MRRILIVDDQPEKLGMLERAVTHSFAGRLIVEAFEDPELALLRCGDVRFDVVIADFAMPGIDGADVLRVVKGLQPEAVRIMLGDTGDFAHMLDRIARVGAFRYLTKPVAPERLCEVLLDAFARHDELAAASPDSYLWTRDPARSFKKTGLARSRVTSVLDNSTLKQIELPGGVTGLLAGRRRHDERTAEA